MFECCEDAALLSYIPTYLSHIPFDPKEAVPFWRSSIFFCLKLRLGWVRDLGSAPFQAWKLAIEYFLSKHTALLKVSDVDALEYLCRYLQSSPLLPENVQWRVLAVDAVEVIVARLMLGFVHEVALRRILLPAHPEPQLKSYEDGDARRRQSSWVRSKFLEWAKVVCLATETWEAIERDALPRLHALYCKAALSKHPVTNDSAEGKAYVEEREMVWASAREAITASSEVLNYNHDSKSNQLDAEENVVGFAVEAYKKNAELQIELLEHCMESLPDCC